MAAANNSKKRKGRGDEDEDEDDEQYQPKRKKRKMSGQQDAPNKGPRMKQESKKKHKNPSIPPLPSAEQLAAMFRRDEMKEAKLRIPKHKPSPRSHHRPPMTIQEETIQSRIKSRTSNGSTKRPQKQGENSKKVIHKIQGQLKEFYQGLELIGYEDQRVETLACWEEIMKYYAKYGITQLNIQNAWKGTGPFMDHMKIMFIFGTKKECNDFEEIVKYSIGGLAETIVLNGDRPKATGSELKRANIIIACPGRLKNDLKNNADNIANGLEVIVIWNWIQYDRAAGDDSLYIFSQLSRKGNLVLVGGTQDMLKKKEEKCGGRKRKERKRKERKRERK